MHKTDFVQISASRNFFSADFRRTKIRRLIRLSATADGSLVPVDVQPGNECVCERMGRRGATLSHIRLTSHFVSLLPRSLEPRALRTKTYRFQGLTRQGMVYGILGFNLPLDTV